jgi:hypothetical protein
MAHPATSRNRPASEFAAGVLAPIGFLAAFLAAGPVSGAAANRPLPLPGSRTPWPSGSPPACRSCR